MTPRHTWNGLPVAPEEPHGSSVVLRRPGADGRAEYLILHRAHGGRDYEGDWAWTPPSGSRQPGEPVLAAALRELAEETGLAVPAADLRALDLGGSWAAFGLDVPSLTPVRLDAEHDRLDWLSTAAAIARCRPDAVSDGIRLAESAMAAEIAFRPLAVTDLRALVGWQHAPHAARWFPERLDLVAAERKYGPRISGESPVRVHVAVVGGRDAGFLQHYPVGPDAAGIDLAIGVPELTGRGLGPQLIWSYVRDVVRRAHTAAAQVVADPDPGNRRSIRALMKAGFAAVAEPAKAGSQRWVLDLDRFFGKAE